MGKNPIVSRGLLWACVNMRGGIRHTTLEWVASLWFLLELASHDHRQDLQQYLTKMPPNGPVYEVHLPDGMDAAQWYQSASRENWGGLKRRDFRRSSTVRSIEGQEGMFNMFYLQMVNNK